MKKRYSLVLLIVVLTLAVGCTTHPNQVKIPNNAARMVVDFSWEGVQACSHESPEIRVSNIPDGTSQLLVRLTDVSVPAWNHGGGRLTYDGSEIIPAGALDIGYNGPCPPDGRHKYEFSIMAVDAEGVIIGFGKARQSFPPKN